MLFPSDKSLMIKIFFVHNFPLPPSTKFSNGDVLKKIYEENEIVEEE